MLYSIPATIFIVWSVSMYYLFFAPPLYIPAEYWVGDIIVIKDYNFHKRDKNKKNIFIISGSNALFGISTKILEEKLNYNIHNLGIHAGMPLVFYLHFVKNYAKKGDIIIAPLEYAYHQSDDKINNWIYSQFTTWATQYQAILPPKMQSELFYKNIYSYWVRLIKRGRTLPRKEKTKLVEEVNRNILFSKELAYLNSNSYGEFFVDKQPSILAENSYLGNSEVSAYFIHEMTEFQAYAKAQEIEFYVTYPVSIKNPLFDTNTLETQTKLKQYQEVFKNMDINFFGTDIFYNLNIKHFLDTQYHLNATGSVLRSLLLAEDINTHILGKKPSYNSESEESIQDFFKQKEKEALTIMKKLRIENTK